MPVSKSAKKALRVSTRRHEENILQKNAYKKAIKTVKKAKLEGSEDVSTLFSSAQSLLDKAAKKNTIHPNKAARLKSRLSKKLKLVVEVVAEKKVSTKVKPVANKKKSTVKAAKAAAKK